MNTEGIKCAECGTLTHSIAMHLQKMHPGMTLEQYQIKHPEAPILSDLAKQKLAEAKKPPAAAPAAASAPGAPRTFQQQPLHEVFGLAGNPGAMSKRGTPIPIRVYDRGTRFDSLIPEIDPNHIWDIEDLKNMLLALEDDFMPLYVWGHKGTGKTTDIEQICARTNRPLLRIQHSLGTEESHIVGQRVLKDGKTPFEDGPLPVAMRHGLLLLVDEYDRGQPGVLACYQGIMEGKPLIIKEAGFDDMVVRPSAHFRFVATGNTNGTGDETGLYQGPMVQDSANYDRFGMTIEKKYRPAAEEAALLSKRTGIAQKDAMKVIGFANKVREAYAGGKLSDTISPRALINIVKIGLRRTDMKLGVQLAYSNKLSRVDRETVNGLAQREFG